MFSEWRSCSLKESFIETSVRWYSYSKYCFAVKLSELFICFFIAQLFKVIFSILLFCKKLNVMLSFVFFLNCREIKALQEIEDYEYVNILCLFSNTRFSLSALCTPILCTCTL